MMQRLGPSASEVDKTGPMSVLMKSLAQIQNVLADPQMRSVLASVAPELLVAATPEGARLDGEGPAAPGAARRSSSSGAATVKPGPVKPATPPQDLPAVHAADRGSGIAMQKEPAKSPADEVKGTAPPAKRVEAAAEDKSAANQASLNAAAAAEINSSTHRAEHARLSRRLEKLDPAQFPNVARLWSGGRQDPLLYICCLFPFCHPTRKTLLNYFCLT